ncbi:type II toxin-antitoxin system VapC family toxin [Cellulomonas sp. Marseille-Q8402]
MTRVAIDARTAVRIVRERVAVPPEHQLVAPTLLRSQVLSLLYRDVRDGVLADAEARALLDGVTTLRIRLLGDRVSRAVAWRIAAQLGWDDTADAEYVAVAQLQADVLVTADQDLARQVEGLVETAPFALLTGLGAG